MVSQVLIGNTRIFFLAIDISRGLLLSEIQSMCAGKFEVSHMTFMSFIIIPGEKKNTSAHGTSGVLFLIKMGCLFCFLSTNENHCLSKQLEKNSSFFSVLVSYVFSLYSGKARAGKS